MREDALSLLRCPISGQPLRLHAAQERQGDRIIDGILKSEDGRHTYRISAGVCDFVNALEKSAAAENTLDLFGAEWQHFRTWGWLETCPETAESPDQYYGGLIEHTRSAFRSKAPFHASDLGPGKRLLDAGCGNGRFSAMAAATGAEVFSVDAGDAAYVARENLANLDNVTVLKADVLNLPFADDSFDAAFSIGVMQHTGDGPQLLRSLSRVVKAHAPFTVNCYGTGLPTYEFIDRSLRALVTRLSRQRQMKFAAALAWIDRRFRNGGYLGTRVRRHLFHHINILPTTTHMFDWYAPEIAEHYSPDQLKDWVAEAGATITDARPAFHLPGYDDRERRRHHAAFQFRAMVN